MIVYEDENKRPLQEYDLSIQLVLGQFETMKYCR